MTPDRVLIFELYGDYAQFRKYFTNMSPLSFSIPPRTVVSGIIGAILGIPKDANPETFTAENSFISLRIVNPITKTKIAHNYLKTSGSMTEFYNIGNHKPTNVEYLKKVRYRIYFAHTDIEHIYRPLKALLASHQSIYTISLGICGCLANYEYLGEQELKQVQSTDLIWLDSIVPMNCVTEIDFGKETNLQKAAIPITMKNNREVTKYDEVLYEQNGKPIHLKLNDAFYSIEHTNETIHGF